MRGDEIYKQFKKELTKAFSKVPSSPTNDGYLFNYALESVLSDFLDYDRAIEPYRDFIMPYYENPTIANLNKLSEKCRTLDDDYLEGLVTALKVATVHSNNVFSFWFYFLQDYPKSFKKSDYWQRIIPVIGNSDFILNKSHDWAKPAREWKNIYEAVVVEKLLREDRKGRDF